MIVQTCFILVLTRLRGSTLSVFGNGRRGSVATARGDSPPEDRVRCTERICLTFVLCQAEISVLKQGQNSFALTEPDDKHFSRQIMCVSATPEAITRILTEAEQLKGIANHVDSTGYNCSSRRMTSELNEFVYRFGCHQLRRLLLQAAQRGELSYPRSNSPATGRYHRRSVFKSTPSAISNSESPTV
jgi:hypothetical protein